MGNFPPFPFYKRKDINTERCGVTQALLSPQLRLSCTTVAGTPGAALPAGHCSTTDNVWVFYIQVPHIATSGIKSLLSEALCTACKYKHEQGLWLMGPTSPWQLHRVQHLHPDVMWAGMSVWLGSPWAPLVPTPVSRGLQPGWKNSPLTKAQHKGPASVGFSLHCCCLQARINFLLGSMKGRAQVSLPWKLLAHENLNLTNC